MKAWKYSDICLPATGVLHTIVAFFVGFDAFKALLGDGLVNSVGGDPACYMALWFLVCGVSSIMFAKRK